MEIHKNWLSVLLIMASPDINSLTPEEKANLSINMTDTCVLICKEGIIKREKGISEATLLKQLRDRMGKPKM